MENNQFFNLRRFGMLCRMEWIGAWKMHLRRFVACYVVLLSLLLCYSMPRYSELAMHISPNYSIDFDGIMIQFLLVFFYASGIVYVSFFMEGMKTKTGRASFLTLPVSAFEKYLSHWLLVTVGFIVVFTVALGLADFTKVLVCRMMYGEVADQINLVSWKEWCDSPYFKVRVCALISGFCFLQSLFVLGSLLWSKNTLIKTCGALAGIVLIHVAVVYLIHESSGGFSRGVYIDDDTLGTFLIVLGAVFAVFNWTLAYFRFKESEIINRW